MSYSFTLRAASKQSARRLLAAKFDEIVGMQPIRQRDITAITGAMNAAIDAVEDDPTHDVTVTCSGYAGTEGASVRHVTINVRVGLAKRTGE